VTLPLALSVPHGGLAVPAEVRDDCLLSREDIVVDGDEGAAEIYGPLAEHVEAFLAADVARAIVDLNRAEDDIRADGVVKTETIYRVPIWREPLSPDRIEELIERYHRPYHERLSRMAQRGLLLGVDGHTMAAEAPPIERNAGTPRPPVCLGDAGGDTLPPGWRDEMVACLEEAFGLPVTVNDPFSGGHITLNHTAEMPWVQIELSRAPFMSNAEKSWCVLEALRRWCARRL